MTFSALDSALTGPLFATDEMREVFSDESRLSAMLKVEAGLARAQARLDIVPEALGAAIDSISPGRLDVRDLGYKTAQSVVTTVPFVKAVQALLPRDVEASFHYGSTAQDIWDSALVLLMRDGFALIKGDLVATLQALVQLSRRHRLTPCAGRTYGQHAAPVTFGYKAAIWAAGIAEVAASFDRVSARACTASCGGPAGTLTSLGGLGPDVAQAFADELGLAAAPIPWHVRRARIVETAAWLATLIGALAKMATDLAYMGSTDLGEVAEPHQPGRGGSSAMPHKRNPVSTSVVIAAFAAAKGHVVSLFDGMTALPERPAGGWQGEWHSLPQLFGLVSGALREARSLAEGLEVYPARMRANLDATKGMLFADVAASRLAALYGRQKAHAIIQQASDAVRGSNRMLRDLIAESQPDPDPAFLQALDAAFDLTHAAETAGLWTDRGMAGVQGVIDLLRGGRPESVSI